jgi:Multiubiquitin
MTQSNEKGDGAHQFQIQIDRVHYTVTEPDLTGAQLRQLTTPPIGQDRDLFEVVPGEPDRKVVDSGVVEIKNGKRFFTAPAQINPGND